MTMIDTGDSRFPKAVQIADQAGQWLKCRTPDGRKAYGVRSQRTPGRYYLVTQTSCTCQDASRHAASICKHALAVQIHCARVGRARPMPASDTIAGLSEMAAQRKPVACNGLGRILGTRPPTLRNRPALAGQPLRRHLQAFRGGLTDDNRGLALPLVQSAD
jgi:SWIM zinc finger